MDEDRGGRAGGPLDRSLVDVLPLFAVVEREFLVGFDVSECEQLRSVELDVGVAAVIEPSQDPVTVDAAKLAVVALLRFRRKCVTTETLGPDDGTATSRAIPPPHETERWTCQNGGLLYLFQY